MLQARGIGLSYGSTVALAGASATVRDGSVVALVGPSGSGKSSLLHCMAGLFQPDAGEVRFDDVLVSSLSEDERSDLCRREFGFVFQFAELVPGFTLRENIGLPLELNGASRGQRRRRVDELIDLLDIGAQADRRPTRVSGGQAQRAAVARAMAHRPRVLFADEPTGSLDSVNGEVVLTALTHLARENATAVVLVTHDAAIASRADSVVSIKDGRTVPPA
jgi:putative ABC transport system ATP-binding protein